jgi:hypothetical protein
MVMPGYPLPPMTPVADKGMRGEEVMRWLRWRRTHGRGGSDGGRAMGDGVGEVPRSAIRGPTLSQP